ncbi:hypothetical protein [Seonamhaeicola marinus]|uniref:Beta-hexosaminidase bacterial type N-terminal domain-containing protein n=1 Tax=Seonamhaeicola marinus TaxID=1912246 RepID=A0A5D0ILY3_9FLAO|nr:hypothetical protein [Seonamhaeicola marinus]TYA84188.1 hypothetical protein FUA24_05920 [Seonamhaeicola marinus]
MKTKLKNIKPWTIILIVFLVLSCKETPKTINIFVDETTKSEIQYGITKLEEALQNYGLAMNVVENSAEAQLIFKNNAKDKENDSFELSINEGQSTLSAYNTRGFLYGLQHIREQLRIGKSWHELTPKTVNAHYGFRAIKFNLPWYSYRKGENLALHHDTCKDLKFWESFLDMMVENKFNVLSLWNLHPYMYMVESEKFPKSKSFTDEEFKEWQAFHRGIFKMAKDRGIDTYVFNWNIFVSDEFSKAYNIGEYKKGSGFGTFWGEGETNALLEEYTREMVTKTINEYPNLTGVGITLGERMGGMTSEERRDWINRTFVKALKDADREAKLFYRAPLSAGLTSHGTVSKSTEILTREAIENIGLENDVYLGFKFNWSHGHSSPKLCIVHGGILTDTYWNPKPKNYKGVYTVRNEDFFALRWAQPDFIRDFINNNSQDYIGGTIIGSETYIPAKDYITKEEHRTWNYAFERQWLFYKVWGNLLYDSDTPDAYFEDALKQKFNITEASELIKGWKLGSMNANRLASFFQGRSDGTLYTEGFKAKRGKFIDIEQFINHPVLDSSYVNIKDFVAGNFEDAQITPIELADIAEKESKEAIAIANALKAEHPENKLLQIELSDIEAWGHYGLYFASKLKGAVALQTYKLKGDKTQQTEAINHLEKGLQHWKSLTEAMERYNVPVMPNQFDKAFSWRKHIKDAENDILVAKKD